MRGYRTLIFALLIFSAATTFSIVKIVREYSIITEKFIPNLWVAAQGNIEFQRLVNHVALAGAGSAEATKDLETRLYILMSRIPLLLQGSESQHVRAVPGAVHMITTLGATLMEIEDEVLSLEVGDAAGALAIYEKLEPFAVPMHQLMGSTMQMDETVASLQRAGLRRVYWELLLCFAGITASATALVFLLFKALRKMKGLLDVAHAAEMAASEARARLSAVMDAVPARISARDHTGREVFRNQYETETAARAAPDADAPSGLCGALDAQVFLTGETVPLFEAATSERDGGQRVWLVTKVPLSDGGGRIVNVVTVALDISEQKEAQRRNALLATALENAGDAIEITDDHGRFEYVNPAFERISGYSSAEAIGETPFSLLMSDDDDGPSYHAVQRVIAAGHPWRGILTAQRKNGELYQQETSISPVRSPEGLISHFVAVKRDITERLQTEQRIWHVAHHDPLTDLPNRVLFLQRLEEAMAEAATHDRLVAVLFLDLDRFKDVNDTLGHHAGDDLLRLLTQRLLATTRETDTVARLGGDEFAIIHTRVRDRVAAGHLAQRILDRLCMPFVRDNQEFRISASIGITIFPDDTEDHQELLRNADLAMYRAKGTGRATFQFFEPGMDVVFQRRKAIERGLRRALELEAFELYYQPQIDLATQRMVGAEALLRWRHPEFGPISPSEFIPVAEESGLIAPIGEWVLETACRQTKAWQDAGLPSIQVAVNLSAAQFLRRDLVGSILRTLERSGLQPQFLELEITEGVVMRDTEGTIAVLHRLADNGVKIALDDFGTGFSSMSYLKRFPVHKIKVDRTFVADVTTDRGDAAIVRAVGTLGRELDIRIAAEGVETAEQAATLRELGCDEVQGFYFGVPMPAGLFERRLMDPAFSHRFRVLAVPAAAGPGASVTAFPAPHRQAAGPPDADAQQASFVRRHDDGARRDGHGQGRR